MKHWWPGLLAITLVALFAAAFTVETAQEDHGYSAAARINPWLAAGRLLERRGLRVSFAPSYSVLPADAQLIVLATPLSLLGSKEQDALLVWTSRGGHLVTTAEESADTDLLKQQLDVQLQENPRPGSKAGIADIQLSLRSLQIGHEGSLQTGFLPRWSLRAGRVPAVWQARDNYGSHVLRFAFGKGRITVLSDSRWMGNDRLGEGDHGALLWRVTDAARGTHALLVYGQDRPSLLVLLWQYAAPLLITLALSVLVWVWQASRRFGPVAASAPAARRRLSEHLKASGRYLSGHRAQALLFNASRQRLLTQAHRRFPQWKKLSRLQLADQLATRSGIDSGAILRLLQTGTHDNMPQFAADIRLINRLRKAL